CAAIARVTQDAVRALGLGHGPIHAELRVSPSGPVVLEVAARSIGGLCARTLRFGTGVGLEDIIVRHALGHDVAPAREARAPGVMMLPIPRAGVLRRVDGVDAARAVPGVEDVVISIPLDKELEPLPEGGSYLGFVFAAAATAAEVEDALRAAHARLAFTI